MKNKPITFNKILPHIFAVTLFLTITFAYFYPQLQGKEILPHDTKTFLGMSKEVVDFREEYGEEALWTNSMFSGMPAFLISVKYSSNIFKEYILVLYKTIGRPASFVFFSMLGFYIALLLFRIDPWLSIAGAFAYAFSTYFLIIIDAGHASKAYALGFMAPIIGSIYFTYNRKLFFGAVLTGVFLATQIYLNHLQITYYTLLIVLVMLIFQFIKDIREEKIMNFIKASVSLIIVSVIAIGVNFSTLYFVNDYGKESIRGKTELTFNEKNETSGLDKEYATRWSYGNWETLTLLIPDFHGGATGNVVDKSTETYKFFEERVGKKQAKEITKGAIFYWGNQPGTSGPVYVGALVVFLFVLGLFLVKGRMKWWLLIITVLSILLAWGKNMMWFTELFMDYFPGYNKFRAVTMILVIAEFAMPLLGIFTIQKIINGEIDKVKLKKAVYWSTGIVGGVCLIFAAIPGAFFDFTSSYDARLEQMGYPLDLIIGDRQSMLAGDAFRSLILVIAGAGALLIFQTGKLKKYLFVLIIAAIFLIDLIPVNLRYLNKDDFVTKREAESPYIPTQADNYILQDKDPYYRVINLATDTWNESATSYFHHSIGGYHGAKMRRYQELISYQIYPEIQKFYQELGQVKTQTDIDNLFRQTHILNMLNAKYFILPGKDNQLIPQLNPAANGNAWFVKEYKVVNSADEEIMALGEFDSKKEVIVGKDFEKYLEGFVPEKDSTASIELTDYKLNHLTYESNTSSEQLAVFSDIYYPRGWHVLVDGQPTEHFRVNYVLRAMRVPEGKHTIEFLFKPEMFATGNMISFSSSILLILLFVGAIYVELFRKKKEIKTETE